MAAITGTETSDTLFGTTGADSFDALGGNDTLVSNGGQDTMRGGRGNDTYIVQDQVAIEERFGFFDDQYGFDTVLVQGDRFVLDGSGRVQVEIEVLQAADASRTTGITLIGNSVTQTIVGGAGSDTLDAGLQGNLQFDVGTSGFAPSNRTDVLIGLGGDDSYVVYNSGMRVVEAVGGGRDSIVIDTFFKVGTGTYQLDPDSEVEIISIKGGVAINIVGNRFDQSITGNDDSNVLNGGGGADTLIGLGGNDTYLVRGQRDVVIETVDSGSDIVYTTASYNLGENSVEALSTVDNSATDPINLVGNFVSQTIVGNFGDNVLNGGSGADTLIGLRGNDVYAVGDARTIVRENAGEGTDTVVTSVGYQLATGAAVEVLSAQDRSSSLGLALTGNEFAQTVVGTNGADTLNGGAGADVLIGGGGQDRFDFTTALGAGNVDALSDFASGDRIGLSAAIFAAVGPSLDAGEFASGTSSSDADDRILYDRGTGQLFYDADGSGSGAAALFALVTPGTDLGVAAFVVI